VQEGPHRAGQGQRPRFPQGKPRARGGDRSQDPREAGRQDPRASGRRGHRGSVKNEPTLRERALRLLARREHSRSELARKLRPHVLPEDDLDALLDDLSKRKQLSDERYAESRAHALSRKFGAARIAQELRAKGVDKGVAQDAAAAARSTE